MSSVASKRPKRNVIEDIERINLLLKYTKRGIVTESKEDPMFLQMQKLTAKKKELANELGEIVSQEVKNDHGQ